MKKDIEQILKKYDISKKTAEKIAEKGIIRYDKQWKYPSMGDSQKTCPMLDAMFAIENHEGIIIFLKK